MNFEDLDTKTFSGQFYSLIILQIVETIFFVMLINIVTDDFLKRNVFICVISLAVFVNFNTACNFIMQITDRISEYAKLILVERLTLLICVFIFLLLGFNSFKYMYFSQVGAVIITAIYGGYLCRDLLRFHFYPIKKIICEFIDNIEVGIKLLVANIASMLIIGVVRYGISIEWDIEIFGKLSLILGISNFLLVFINSISVVLFPMLKNMDSEQLPRLYIKIRYILALLLFFMLLFYYPLKEILLWWLPQYADSLKYMAVLFPICLFESKVSLLINTYLKSMRQEALMLKINICSVIFSVVVTYFTVFIINDLEIAVLSIIVLYAFRCELAEYFIERLLNISIKKDVFMELILVSIFVAAGYVYDNYFSLLIYGCAYSLYLIINYRKFLNLAILIKR